MGNTNRQSYALFHLAQIKWYLGDYSTAQKHAYESRRLAKISADLYTEALALQVETVCWTALGNYNQSIALCSHGRALLALCGMSGGEADHSLMTSHAEVHKFKSEYIEARSIHNQILEEVSMQQDPYAHGLSLLNLADIDVSIGTLRNDVQRNIDTAKSIFTPIGYLTGIQWCDILQAGLELSHPENMVAHRLFQDGVRFSRGRDSEMLFHCLERLADVSCWRTVIPMSTWTTVFLAHSIKSNRRPAFHKALQYLGDAFLARGDEDTAISLFIVALEAFTYMGVHCSRAECMLRLGDISKRHGDLLKAVEHWEAARPLFERSSQARKVEKIDERLAGIKSPKKNSSSREEEETSDPSSYSNSDYTGDAEYHICTSNKSDPSPSYSLGESQPSNLEATKDKEVVDDLTAPSTTKATNSSQVTSSSFRIFKATNLHSQATSTPPVSDFNQAEEIKTGTFAIYSPHDEKPELEYVS
jgi:tetratricopeptide (TPR) repeat protein